MGYFDENRKFLGLNGVLGRRDFVINCLIIETLESLIFITPLIYSMIFSSEMQDIIMGNIKPMWFLVVQCVFAIVSTGLYYPSIVRRIRDIIGEENDNKVYMASSITAVILFMGYTPVATNIFGHWVLVFTICLLLFLRGKITGEKPKSDIIKFNWGAFLGTWIWGIFNKIPKTLLILPLFITFAWVPFALICGLKGNEWAYSNKQKYSSCEEFHKSQATQSTIWAILTPFLFIISSILITFISALILGAYSAKNPDFASNLEKKALEIKAAIVNESFQNVELTQDEYKFYADPKIWVSLTQKQKSSLFSVAVSYVMQELKIELSEDKTTRQKQSLEISRKTKIYSSFNNELLAEFKLTYDDVKEALENINEKGGFKKYYKLLNDAYEFNNNPTLP